MAQKRIMAGTSGNPGGKAQVRDDVWWNSASNVTRGGVRLTKAEAQKQMQQSGRYAKAHAEDKEKRRREAEAAGGKLIEFPDGRYRAQYPEGHKWSDANQAAALAAKGLPPNAAYAESNPGYMKAYEAVLKKGSQPQTSPQQGRQPSGSAEQTKPAAMPAQQQWRPWQPYGTAPMNPVPAYSPAAMPGYNPSDLASVFNNVYAPYGGYTPPMSMGSYYPNQHNGLSSTDMGMTDFLTKQINQYRAAGLQQQPHGGWAQLHSLGSQPQFIPYNQMGQSGPPIGGQAKGGSAKGGQASSAPTGGAAPQTNFSRRGSYVPYGG